MPDGRTSERGDSDQRRANTHQAYPVADPERLHRRAVLLREIAEARARVARAVPWRAGSAGRRISQIRRGLR